MKFSRFLVVIALLSTPALAVTTIRGSKSNSSSERVTCNTQACCQQHPGAGGCNGNVLKTLPTGRINGAVGMQAGKAGSAPIAPTAAATISPRLHSDGAGTEKNTTIKGGKSNNYKDIAPTPRPGFNNSKSNNYKEAEPTPVGPVVTTTTINASKSNSLKEVAPTGPTPKPVENKNLNSNRSN